MIGVVYLTIVAAGCAALGTGVLARRVHLFLTGRQAQGRFVRWETRGLRKKYHHPVVAFETSNGCTHEFVGMPGRTSKREGEGADYCVLYPEHQPEKAMVHSLLGYWAAPAAMFVPAAAAGWAAYKQVRP